MHLIVLRHLWVLRKGRPWDLAVNGVFEPFLYLMAIGVGVGQMISGGDSYASFVAPALLATSAMNSAISETTGGVWWRLRFEKFYDAILNTPLSVRDIGNGEIAASVLRSTVSSACFFIVILALGMVESWWALLVLPAAILVAYAFSALGMAVTTMLRDFHHHQYLQLCMLPMFLFATTFFPLSVYPEAVRWAVAALPLYHAIELLRGLSTGNLGAGLTVSVVYLAALGIAGTWLANRRLSRLLIG